MNRKSIFISAVTAVTALLMTFPSSAYIKGDANGDGKLDIRDASFITRAISSNQIGLLDPEEADYNGDGVVNVRDAAAISMHIAKIKPQPVTISTTAKAVTKVVIVKPTPVKPKHDIVYITRTGKKYHYSSTCNGGKYFPVKIEDALKKGMKPCIKCVL